MKKGCLITIIIVLLLAISIVGWLYYNIKVPVGKSSENKFFEVKENESTFEIANNLKEKGFIRNPTVFAYLVKIKGVSLYPGLYYLRENMNLDEIVKPISTRDVQEYKITIPEGWRVTQIDEYLASKKIFSSGEFAKAAEGKEGYLFPDTYRVPIDINPSELVKKMSDNFSERTKDYKLSNSDIIIASIVEREAKKNEDRAKIAGVYLNRLNQNMYLGADPTIQYALGNWDPLSLADLKINSLYNTYINKGLPPTPICNPGLASIKSVLSPEKNGWFYFFNLKDGTAIFSHDAAEHDLNKAKYHDQIAN